MLLKSLKICLFFLMFSFLGRAQDCTLNAGGDNTAVLIKVFQLNDKQTKQLEIWKAEFAIEAKVIEDDIKQLFNTHPQSTAKELSELADKYKALQQKMIKASKALDKKLLGTFYEKQYERYLSLCNEVLRRPIRVVPLVLKDSITSPE